MKAEYMYQPNKLLAISIAALTIAGCTTLEEDVAEYRTYSCTGIAQEIGRWEQKLDDAETDGDIAVLDQILGDKKEREDAETDELVADFDEADARDHLRELRRIQAEKGCPAR